MTSRLKFSVMGRLLAGLTLSAAAATWQPETTEWSKNPDPVAGDWGFDRQGHPKGVFKQSWQESAFWHYDRCLRSEMCMERIPEPIIGSIGAKPDPNFRLYPETIPMTGMTLAVNGPCSTI